MKLKELINSNHWLSVELTLLQIYPDQKDIIDEYKKVFEKLQLLDAEDYDMNIVLTEYDCDTDDESEVRTYVDVSGRKSVREENSITDGYAIEFVEWRYWLGMDLAHETIKNFTDLEIIVHCLYEMTFIDYDEAEIKEQFDTINDRVEEYKNLTEDEKKEQTTSLEELKKQLDQKGSS
ncbi:MAG TPA: hypothetical protein PKV73_14650 [Agriterribacter sp.]|nr:hypothetical protein [Agriterribacter sp.]